MTTAFIERQWPLDAGPISLGIANLGTGNGVTITLPPKSYLKSISGTIVTAFNSGTTATATVSDGTTTFVNAGSIAATGQLTVANLPKYYPSGGTITVSAAQTGTNATTGQLIVTASYTILGRANEVDTN